MRSTCKLSVTDNLLYEGSRVDKACYSKVVRIFMAGEEIGSFFRDVMSTPHVCVNVTFMSLPLSISCGLILAARNGLGTCEEAGEFVEYARVSGGQRAEADVYGRQGEESIPSVHSTLALHRPKASTKLYYNS